MRWNHDSTCAAIREQTAGDLMPRSAEAKNNSVSVKID